MLAHDPGARLGTDAEDVHQLRVATRRLRAFLRAARPLVEPDWGNALREELSWLGAALGPVRDADVLLAHLHEEAELLEAAEREAFEALLSSIEGERAHARDSMLKALDSDRYLALLDGLEEAAASGPPLVGRDRSAAALVRADVRRLRRAAEALGDEPTDDALHETRIRAKRARYVSELAAPLLGKQARRLGRGAERLQDALGAHQDAVVAEQRIRALLQQSTGPAAHFAAGRLVERQRARRAAARASYADAWKRFERLRVPASKS
jgi:CHAD domain-containing protein